MTSSGRQMGRLKTYGEVLSELERGYESGVYVARASPQTISDSDALIT